MRPGIHFKTVSHICDVTVSGIKSAIGHMDAITTSVENKSLL